MSLSDTTSRVISLKRDCAASMTARRSLSLLRFSPVVCAWLSSPWPSLAPTESSRSATRRARSVCREPSHSDMPPIRPLSSALACVSCGEARLDRLLPLVGDLALAPPRRVSAPKREQAQRRDERQSRAERFGERYRACRRGRRGGRRHLRLADALSVMAGLVPAIHAAASPQRRGSPGFVQCEMRSNPPFSSQPANGAEPRGWPGQARP